MPETFPPSLMAVGVGVLIGWAIVSGLAAFTLAVGRWVPRLSPWLTRAPGLDVVVFAFTLLPMVLGAWSGGWTGWAGAVVGQAIGLGVFCIAHEWSNGVIGHHGGRASRIVTVINRTVGRGRNHLALWVTTGALPVFWLIRVAQVGFYPMLVGLLDFPRYRQSEWVNVSRQKFAGLVGHDLVWCLYCDWMTGVYALGAEMLRNVESFWCPIRFLDGQKCENCKLDFPDVLSPPPNGWVAGEGSMRDVADVLGRQYGDGRREWFGHPARRDVSRPQEPGVGVTVNGHAPANAGTCHESGGA